MLNLDPINQNTITLKSNLHHTKSRNEIESVQSYGVSLENAHLKQNLHVIASQKWEERPWYDTQQIGDTT